MVISVPIHSLLSYALVLLIVKIRRINLLHVLVTKLLIIEVLISWLKVAHQHFTLVGIVINNASSPWTNIVFVCVSSIIIYILLIIDSLIFRLSHCLFVCHIIFNAMSCCISQFRMLVCNFNLFLKSLFFIVKFANAILNHLLLQIILLLKVWLASLNACLVLTSI